MRAPNTSRWLPFGIVLLVLLALLVVSCWWWASAGKPPEVPVAPPTGRSPTVVEHRALDEASRTLVPPVPPPAADPAPVRIRGRTLAAESAAPLAGVVLRAALDGDADDRELATATSGGDGTFELTVVLATPNDLRLTASMSARAAIEGTRERVPPGALWDVGDVLLVRAASVRGEVVDTTGEGVEGAVVMLVQLGSGQPAMQGPNLHQATTDARGAFVIDQPVAGGEWYVRVDGTGALRTPRKLEVPPGGEHSVRIEVERPDPAQAITGKVVDRTGLPLAGIELSAYGEGFRGSASSRADGSFTLHRGPPHFANGKPGVEVTARAATMEMVGPALVLAWGKHDVDVVMQTLATAIVRAVDARGADCSDFDVLYGMLGPTGETLIDYPARLSKHLADGTVQLSGLHRGEHVLLVRPRATTLALGGPVPFVVGGDSPLRELRVSVPDRVELQVEVVDADGRGITGCKTTLLLGLTKAPVEPSLPAPVLAGLRSSGLRGQRQLALAAATSDAGGIARLSVPPGRCWLHVRSADHLPSTSEIVVSAAEPRQRVVLQAATVLHGRLVPLAAVQAMAADGVASGHALAVVARRLVDDPEHTSAAVARNELAKAEVAVDGAFTLGPLPPGGVRLRLEAWLTCNAAQASVMASMLGELDTDGGRSVEREFAVDALLPASANGVVRLDGEPVTNEQFFLQREQPLPPLTVRINTDAEGRFTTRLPPGRYRPLLAIPSQPGPGHIILPLPMRCEIAAGATAVVAVDGRARRLHLRLLAADGTPLANRRLRIDRGIGYDRPGALGTDANGVVEWSPAPFDAFFVLVVTADGSELRLGPIELPPGDGAAELEFRAAK